MEDIICSIPWSCGGECEAHWHIANYWIYRDGTYTIDRYGDGDCHDSIDESDVPSYEDIQQAWADYWRFVLDTNTDPLDQVIALPTKKTKRQWQARLRLWIGASTHGLKVTGVRRRGRGPWKDVSELPAAGLDYLFLCNPDYNPSTRDITQVKSCIGPEFPTVDALIKIVGNAARTHGSHSLEVCLDFEIEEERQPTEKQIRANIRRVAQSATKNPA